MTDAWRAEIEAIEKQIAEVEAELKAKLAQQVETGRELNTLRRKKVRLKQKLIAACPYDATIIPGRTP